MIMLRLLSSACLLCVAWVHLLMAQPSTADLAQAFPWRNIGPANMMGRISAVDGYHADYRVLLVGAASGGVWKTTNAGTTWTPIFDDYGSQSIGDVVFFQPDTSIIWVGTGEANNRNSVGWGDGVYQSTDGGKTFSHVGLRNTYQISKIAPHPTDPDIVYVAALGHLFDYTGDRGLYKTVDGGKTWEKLTNGLPDDGRVGATVVVIDPTNPEIVYAGMYDRLRRPYHMQSGGPEGGLYKSVDGGASWTKLTNGLPTGQTGQIDLDLYLQNTQTIVAYVEADENVPADEPGGGIYRSDDGGASWTFQLKHFSRPYYHGRIRIDPNNDQQIYVVSRDFMHSTDGGKTYTRGRPWTVDGGDDHDLWVSPQDSRVILMATDQGARLSLDGGESAFMFNNMAIGQFYAIGVDMRDPYWVYGGLQDNGGWATPSNSRDPRGILTDHVTVVNGGDGFHMQIDPTDWRLVYTMSHVGFLGVQNMETRQHEFLSPRPETIVNFGDVYNPDFDEHPIDYTINPGDYWLWFDQPSPTINGSGLPPQFRFNWNSPLVMSPTNPHTLYVGGNYLFKSVDQGRTWRIISPDLTRNTPETRNPSDSGGLTKDVTGAENHHTIYTIDESVLNTAVIWVGTDDGYVQLTKDGGATWTNVTANIPDMPEGIWVSRVEASQHDAATAYVTLDGHWIGDINPYVYKTTDFGATWTNLSTTIPHEMPGNSVYTIVEDPVNPNLLFIGTEFGCFFTIDGGKQWTPFMTNLPPVAVHDLVIHPRDHDLIAGTHGRSIWIADDISPLRQITPEVLNQQALLLQNRVGTHWLNFSKGRIQTHFKFRGQNPPRGAAISYYLNQIPEDSTLTIHIEDPISGQEQTLTPTPHAGLNRVHWNMQFAPSDSQIEQHRQVVEQQIKVIDTALKRTRDEEMLFHMQRDLIAPHRYPNLYEDVNYGYLNDARGLLHEHLEHIQIRLENAQSVRHFSGIRNQLIAYSSLVGDAAYTGFFGEPLQPQKAAAGTYRVRLQVGGQTFEGTLKVREDPLINEN